MATTNLISKSLGDILLESGNGSPDHTSPKGSIYSDKDTGIVYKNNDGGTVWINFNGVAHGEVYYVDNTNATTISSSNVWVSAGNTFTEGDVTAFSANTDTMVLLDGYDGKYNIVMNATIDYVGGTDNFGVGVSINGGTPPSVNGGAYNFGNVDSTYTTANISSSFVAELTGGTTLELAVLNSGATNNIIVQHGQIFAKLLN